MSTHASGLANSLRVRLMALIMAPLAVIACVLGYWRYEAAIATADVLFDRSLLATALAISRDVTVSGGDALSPSTSDLIAEAAGGTVYYHVSGPDRAYVTGYAYPPVAPAQTSRARTPQPPVYFGSRHRGEPVRVVRLVEQTTVGPLSGLAIITVWQRAADRAAFARMLAYQSAALIAILVVSVAVAMWISVNRGLRPLLDLEDAIAARSSDDLGTIRRKVPREVAGIVRTLNTLFEQVNEAIRTRDTFISNAAHQLRNPVAGMLALAEAAESAPTDALRRARVRELRDSAARTARLTQQMLAFETVRGRADDRALTPLDLDALVTEVATRNAGRALGAGIAFDFTGPGYAVCVQADRVLLAEALENLIDNALCHGPPTLTRIAVTLAVTDDTAAVTVADDGTGLAPEDAAAAFERFGQIGPSEGSGLGLAIAVEIARLHKARLTVDRVAQGASLTLRLPRAPAPAGAVPCGNGVLRI